MNMEKISGTKVLIFSILLLAFLSFPGGENWGAEFELVAAARTAVDYPWTKSLFEFDRLMNDRTGGRVRLKIHHSGALGDEREIAESVMRGTIAMGVPALNRLALWEPDFDVWGFPYLATDAKDVIELVKGLIFRDMAEKFRNKHGIRVLAPLTSGFRCIANNKRPIETKNDLRDIKLRVAPSPLSVKTYNLMGCQAVPMPMQEVFSALQQRVIDGYENDPASHYIHKYYEVTKYLSITNTIFLFGVLIVNEKVFQSMPSDLQYMFLGSADDTRRYNDKLFLELTASAIEKLKQAGTKVNYPKLDQFKEAVKPAYEEFSKKLSKGLVEAVVRTAPRGQE